jgi:beta-phosphoglucomutase-like phosphatase (HAD superfamily)
MRISGTVARYRIPGVTDPGRPALFVDRLEAVVFDTDGVLTDIASVHAAAWWRLFDEYLMRRGSQRHEPFRAFTEADYLRHVDGRSRYDGVTGFLAERGADVVVADLGELALQGGPVRRGHR